MNLNGLKYLGSVYYQQIKQLDPEEAEEWVHDLGETDAKSKNKIIEVDFGRRKATYFPCGCQVTLWFKPYYNFNNAINREINDNYPMCKTWKCEEHRPHKGWSTKGR